MLTAGLVVIGALLVGLGVKKIYQDDSQLPYAYMVAVPGAVILGCGLARLTLGQ